MVIINKVAGAVDYTLRKEGRIIIERSTILRMVLRKLDFLL